MDPISGAVVVVDYLPTSGYRPPGLTVARLPSQPEAVPELGLSALVVLITGLGLTGCVLIWRLRPR
jgi:hypothetical protein